MREWLFKATKLESRLAVRNASALSKQTNQQEASLVNVASAYLNAGQDAGREGTAHASIVPYQAFATKDGHLVVAAMNDRQFVRLYGPI